jgi:hypothetical protein
MENNFSAFEVRLLKSLLSKRSDEDIALMLERPVCEVSEKINELTGGISPFQEKLLQKKKQQERREEIVRQKKQQQQAKKDVEKKRTVSSRIIAHQTADRIQARKRRDEPKYVTKEIDLSKLVAVRIDHRTVVFAKPGEDPDKVREKYFSNQKLPKNISPSQRNNTVEVKKFKPIK